MKLECDVIRDLLPLYAEKLASPASSALVEQHLSECPACRAELEQMEKPVPVQPEPQPDAPLKNIRKTLQKKSIRIAAAAVLAVLCAFGLVFWMGGAKTPVTAEQAKIWTYNKKENEANLCVLEVQGENVRLELEGSFNWGNPSVTVRAVRYTFPHIHAALDGLKDYDGKQDVRAWLFTVARNAYYDHCRRAKHAAPLEDAETKAADSPDIAQLLVDKDAAFTVHQCLHALEEPYKEVFSLRVFGELPFDRIGAIFGHNAAWARVTYYRAKTRIQTMLEQRK
ncbi:sigma-70 family RNA polymerase sigma factor [Faecalibacterium prausnitzii]|uniref:sigma-70 family RNA polymerase sigma factor n=1 Tax=Faecalibacterium prausnitzii TaxID=853 RepID=UPI001FAA1033|nr:sigma-70 family RNA polymerase sigma factor [Faecalibacterium prausnitzii]